MQLIDGVVQVLEVGLLVVDHLAGVIRDKNMNLFFCMLPVRLLSVIVVVFPFCLDVLRSVAAHLLVPLLEGSLFITLTNSLDQRRVRYFPCVI